MEISGLNSRLEDEQNLVAQLQKKIKELQVFTPLHHNDDIFHFFFTCVIIRTISFVTIDHHILDDISHFIDAFVLTVIIYHQSFGSLVTDQNHPITSPSDATVRVNMQVFLP